MIRRSAVASIAQTRGDQHPHEDEQRRQIQELDRPVAGMGDDDHVAAASQGTGRRATTARDMPTA
jgi:hypothetical protein